MRTDPPRSSTASVLHLGIFLIQVKAFCAGGIILADISLFQKILAALITGDLFVVFFFFCSWLLMLIGLVFNFIIVTSYILGRP